MTDEELRQAFLTRCAALEELPTTLLATTCVNEHAPQPPQSQDAPEAEWDDVTPEPVGLSSEISELVAKVLAGKYKASDDSE